jgi:hypothetical protein
LCIRATKSDLMFEGSWSGKPDPAAGAVRNGRSTA